MLAFLQYIFAYVIAREGAAPLRVPGPESDVPAIVGVVLAFWLAGALIGLWLRARAGRDDPRTLMFLIGAANAGRVASLVAFTVIAWALEGRNLPRAVGLDGVVMVRDVVRLAPFFLLVLAVRAALHPAMRRLGVGPPTLRESLGSELRQAVLPLLPLLGLFVAFDLVEMADPASQFGSLARVVLTSHVLQVLFALSVVFVGLLAMPFVLRLAWRAKPLPAGPLRTRLEAYMARTRFKARDILIWPADTHLNAAVVGALPAFRYVIVTKALLETLQTDEIEAVFAHEAGHAKRGHILLFFGFTAVLPLALLMPGSLGTGAMVFLATIHPLLRLGLIVLVWLGVVFGFVSRRFEQEADVYGLETLQLPGGPPADPKDHPFARALERIATEAGGIRELTGWRHFSIADRVEFVHHFLNDAAVRARYRRNIFLLRFVLLASILGFALPAAAQVPGAVRQAVAIWNAGPMSPESALMLPLNLGLQTDAPAARARFLLQAAALAGNAGRIDDQLRWLREATALSPKDPLVMVAYAVALEAAGRPRGAILAWQDVLAMQDVPGQVEAGARERIETLRKALEAR